MNHYRFFLLSLLWLCLTSCEKTLFNPTGGLEITVRDPVGKLVQDAEVSLQPGDHRLLTDAEGVAAFSKLPIGLKEVTVAHPEYRSTRQLVEIIEDDVLRVRGFLEFDENTPLIQLYTPHREFAHPLLEGDLLMMNFVAYNEIEGPLTYQVHSDLDGEVATGKVEGIRGQPVIEGLQTGEHRMQLTVSAASDHSTTIAFSVVVYPRPDVPVLTLGDTGPDGVSISWTSVDHPLFGDYTVLYSDDDTSGFHFLTSSHEASATEFFHQNIPFGHDAYYRIVLEMEGGQKFTSNTVAYRSPVKRVQLEDAVADIRLDVARQSLYVADFNRPVVAVYRSSDLSQITEIQLQGVPGQMQIAEDRNEMYVAVPEAGVIQIIDLVERAVKRTLPAYSPAGAGGTPYPQRVVPLANDLLAYTGYGGLRGRLVLASALSGDTLRSYTTHFSGPRLAAPPSGAYLYQIFDNSVARYAVSPTGLELEEKVGVERQSNSTGHVTPDGRFLINGNQLHDALNLSRVHGTYPGRVIALSPNGTLAATSAALVEVTTFAPVVNLPNEPTGVTLAAIDDSKRQVFVRLMFDQNRVYQFTIDEN